MRLAIPFTYTAEALIGRSQNPRREMFVEEMSVDIPEVTDADAPIAMTVATQYNSGQRPARDVYRYHNGRFLMYDTPGRHGLFSMSELIPVQGNPRADQLGKVFDREWYLGAQRALSEWFRNPGYTRQRKPRPDQVSEWLSSDRDKAVERTRTFADGLLSVAGKLWFSVAEPKLAAGIALMPYLSVDSKPFDQEVGQYGDPVATHVFNVKDRDGARAFLAANPGTNITFDWNTLDVRMPEVFVFDRHRHALEWVAREAVRSLGSEIGDKPIAVVSEWINARSLVEGQCEDSEWEENMAEAVVTILPHIATEEVREHLTACLGVWNAKTREQHSQTARLAAIR
jgi:hypothetical protein|nr:hypothetical protein [Neorhizobium tomejilense]